METAEFSDILFLDTPSLNARPELGRALTEAIFEGSEKCIAFALAA